MTKRKIKIDVDVSNLELFDLKPCGECPFTCVEGMNNIECPYDEAVKEKTDNNNGKDKNKTSKKN